MINSTETAFDLEGGLASTLAFSVYRILSSSYLRCMYVKIRTFVAWRSCNSELSASVDTSVDTSGSPTLLRHAPEESYEPEAMTIGKKEVACYAIAILTIEPPVATAGIRPVGCLLIVFGECR